jgi:predicted PurR-regulated permease PerM
VRRVLVTSAVSLGTLLGVVLLWKLRGAAALLGVSLVAAATVRPFVEALEVRVGRALALVVVYLAGLALFGVFVYVATHGFLREVDRGLERVGAAYDRLRRGWAGAGAVSGYLLARLPPAAAVESAAGGLRPSTVLGGLLGLTLNALDLVGRFLVVLALSAYWSVRRESFERLWLSLLPPATRARARAVWRAVEGATGAHLRSELGQSLLAVLLVGLVFHLGGLPTPMLPALAAGLLRLAPFFGPALAAGVSFLAGSALSPAAGALAAAYTLLVLLLLDRWLARHVFCARRPSPTLVVFLLVALVDAWGAGGLLAAPTLAAAVQALVACLIATNPRRVRRARSLADIEARIARARQRLLLVSPQEAALLGNVIGRLGALAAEARAATETRRSRSSAERPAGGAPA